MIFITFTNIFLWKHLPPHCHRNTTSITELILSICYRNKATFLVNFLNNEFMCTDFTLKQWYKTYYKYDVYEAAMLYVSLRVSHHCYKIDMIQILTIYIPFYVLKQIHIYTYVPNVQCRNKNGSRNGR